MDHAARGAAALAGGDAVTAVSAYTEALIQNPSSPDYFIQRSTAFIRLKAPHQPQHELSLIDAEYAVLLGQKRARREKIQAGQQRRVIAMFGLQRYGDAAFILGTMEKWRTKEKKDKMEGDLWKAKIDQKLRGLPEDDAARQVRVKEYPERALPSDSIIKKMLQGQLNADGIFHFGGDVQNQPDGDRKADLSDGESNNPLDGVPANAVKVEKESIVSITPATSLSEGPTEAPKPLLPIRHEWFQNASNVTITIYAKSVPKDQTDVEINEDSVSVSFPHPSKPTSTFNFALDPLFAMIDPAASKCSVMSTKIELMLRKKTSSQKWNALEGSAPLKRATGDADESSTKAAVLPPLGDSESKRPIEASPSYPTSSRSGPKNWDKLASDLTAKKSSKKQKQKDKSEKGEGAEEGTKSDNEDGEDDDVDSDFGGDPVDGFFKKLYAGADDDTRRAMMKSYQESGGTALSTDWKDVGKRRVDPVESKND